MPLPYYDYRRTDILVPDKVTEGLDNAVDSVNGRLRRRAAVLRSLMQDADAIDAMAPSWETLSDRHLQDKLVEFKDIFRRRPRGWEETTFPALAAIREASARKLGMRPFVVQLAGALALLRGCLAEMATGEGKTLVAGLTAVIQGWTRQPCHVITVNDYLARRDPEWLGPLYAFCRVSTGCVTGEMEPRARVEAYAQDVTYTTSKEILADFLRDRLRMGMVQNASRRHIRYALSPQLYERDGLVMRGIHVGIVDEADSVLIDEAVTPLIISHPQENHALKNAAGVADAIARHLVADIDYEVNRRYKEIEFKDSALAKIEALCDTLPGIWRGPDRRLELVRQALTAKEFFLHGQQYVLEDNKVVIVDEFTGRMMPQRTWRQGLHQAIEAKEGIPLSNPSETMARLSFQRFFRFFHHLSGMTGTAAEAAAEFWHIYRLPVITIPLNRPSQRVVLPDCVFPNQESKWDAVVAEISQLHNEGLPVLVGTRNVFASEHLAERLSRKGFQFALLNATRHREEAQIVAQAGHAGHITIATNMAGRGTDIILEKGVAERGGLQVLITERHESRRIDRQFFGRCGRQGDPGRAQAFVSMEDELLRRFLPPIMRRTVQSAIIRNQSGWNLQATAAFAWAQRTAQRLAFKQRRQVLKMDTWIEDALSFASAGQPV